MLSELDSGAAMLAAGPAGESPAGGDCPVDTVVILGSREGDRPTGSPRVKVLLGRASNSTGRSGSEPGSPEMLHVGECRTVLNPVKASAVGSGTGYMTADGLPGVLEDDMPRRTRQRKHGTTDGSPRRARTAKASSISLEVKS